MKGKCKKCRKLIEAPEDVTSFSCMYCGAKLSHRDVFVTDEPEGADSARSHFSYALENISTCLSEHRDIMQYFNRETYRSSFTKYKTSCYKVFNELNTAALLDEENSSSYISQVVDRFMSDTEAYWQQQPDWAKKKRQDDIIEKDKLIIAIYMAPMVKNLDLSVSNEFNELLQKRWAAKYPKNLFYVGSYEDILESFNARLSCFITTAVCKHSGKPDNCYELETLRSFRDNWLAHSPDGTGLINEYYRIAPAIVCCMDLTGGNYDELNTHYIEPCLLDIERGNMESCRSRYIDMVRRLEKKYLS